MKHKALLTYESPEIELFEVEVERGFQNSMEDPFENDEIEW
jgi:hypothetical protein